MPGTAVRGASHDPGTDWTEPLSYPCKADLGRAEASAAVAYGAVIAPGPLVLPREGSSRRRWREMAAMPLTRC
jgi:hypothetical protein